MTARKTAAFPADIRARIDAVAQAHAAVARPEGIRPQDRDAREEDLRLKHSASSNLMVRRRESAVSNHGQRALRPWPILRDAA